MARSGFAVRTLWIVFSVLPILLIACQGRSSPAVPPVSQFKSPAVGTPIPVGKELAPIGLPPGVSGVMFINRTDKQVSVAVSGTITAISGLQSFLFVLPAGTYEFYIYKLDAAPGLHIEKTEAGKVRYVYLLPKPQ